MGMHRGSWHRWFDEEEDEYERRTPDAVLLKRMVGYIFRHRNRSLMLFLAVLISTLINIVPPFMFTLAIDKYIAKLNLAGLAVIGGAFIFVYTAGFAAQFGQRYLTDWLGSKLEFDLKMDVFRHLQKLSLSFYEKQETGRLVSQTTNDVDKITELVTSSVASVIADLLTLIGIIAVMVWMNTRLSLITFTVIPLIAAFLYVWGRKARMVYRETRRTIASVSAKMEESVSGMKEIQSYSREGETQLEFQQVNISNMQANVQAGQLTSAFWPAVNVFTAIGNFLVLWFGGTAVMNGALSIGVLFGFMSYLNRFFWPIQDLSSFWNNIQSSLAAAERVFGITDTKIDIEDKPNAVELDGIAGKISYDNITFSYVPGQPVLKNINFTIEPNTTVALVGPTGVGKTTLINLLYRFYDPNQGKITVDDHDLRDVKIGSLRKQMAIVLQDTFLFSGTVRDNIRYGRIDATDEEITSVAETVGVHQFVTRLPERYDTDVWERGSRLSVGQRQLISLARALLANPKILIMDEATSSVDPYTELIIQKAMEEILKDRTSIIIAHRLSTVRKADKIVVLEEGEIVEIGNHEELIQKGGLYKHLYEMQFRDED